MFFNELKPGKSVQGHDIKIFHNDTKADRYIYLMAGVHGDEVEGVYLLDKLFKWLKTDESLQLPLIVIPIVNVDGYQNGTRVNSNGVDLNRNLPTKGWTSEAREAKYFPGKEPMSEPENQFLDKTFKKYPPKIILSFHSWKRFINVNGNCLKEGEYLAKFNNYPIINGEIEGHPTPGSLGEYAVEEYQSPVLTFECPHILDEDISLQEIWLENEVGFKELMKFLQSESR
jgi:murein peptide amidase A